MTQFSMFFPHCKFSAAKSVHDRDVNADYYLALSLMVVDGKIETSNFF